MDATVVPVLKLGIGGGWPAHPDDLADLVEVEPGDALALEGLLAPDNVVGDAAVDGRDGVGALELLVVGQRRLAGDQQPLRLFEVCLGDGVGQAEPGHRLRHAQHRQQLTGRDDLVLGSVLHRQRHKTSNNQQLHVSTRNFACKSDYPHTMR
eukprot:scaffold27523_cov34-Prasinocladus_malaysianus.AAC.1